MGSFLYERRPPSGRALMFTRVRGSTRPLRAGLLFGAVLRAAVTLFLE